MILDGHHRFQICNELGIEAKFEVKEFPNALLEKKFVIESNLRRRHLNRFQRAKLVLPLLEIEKELARGRQEGMRNIAHISGKKIAFQYVRKRQCKLEPLCHAKPLKTHKPIL